VPRTECSECVAKGEDVVVPADAVLHARGESHGISKVVVRSSVLCAWFSSSGTRDMVRLSYEIRMRFRYRGSDLMRISWILLDQAGINTW
jgi:hypothetical protein